MEYRNVKERMAHFLTGYICGQCKCSREIGWSKIEMQPKCECYTAACQLNAMVNEANRQSEAI